MRGLCSAKLSSFGWNVGPSAVSADSLARAYSYMASAALRTPHDYAEVIFIGISAEGLPPQTHFIVLTFVAGI